MASFLINPMKTGNTLLCSSKFGHLSISMSSTLSCNSKAFASELQDNSEEMFPQYFKSSAT